MAEEKQEDMSMDEILSSIKNILSENGEPVQDSQSSTAETQTNDMPELAATPTEPSTSSLDLDAGDISVNDLPFNEEDDNILDLTSDMRADVPDVETTATPEPETEIDIDRELENVADVVNAEPEPQESLLNQSVNETQDHDVPVLPEVSVISDDTDSDPIYTPEDEASSQPLYKGADDTLPEVPEVSTQDDAFNIEEISLDEDALPVANQQPAEDKVEAAPETKADAVDVSASIINNFAKIFADNKTETSSVEPVKVSASVKLGADATLSDMVKATIRDMISEQIVHTLAQDTDIKALVSEEVSAQIKAWLDKHLPSMVEDIVKKEIERVMVKAGRS